MGLDMYLVKKIYVKNWDHMDKSEKHKITVEKGGELRTDIDYKNISYIVEEVAYWCKANQIHQWFVNNVQDGVDNCGYYYVDDDKFRELLDICKTILRECKLEDGVISNGYTIKADSDGNMKQEPILELGRTMTNQDIAKELLPTQDGFFFGGTDYDQWYYEDIKYTADVLEKALKSSSGEFYYQSSW